MEDLNFALTRVLPFARPVAQSVLGPHPFAGGSFYGESPYVRERRHASAVPALTAVGFAPERCALDALAGLVPWPFPTPNFAFAAARGNVQGAEVVAYEFGTIHGTASAPALQASTVVLIQHARIDGRAQIRLDPFPDKEPPGVFARMRATIFGAETGPEDLVVGDPAFDHRYLVYSPSIEAARRAIPLALSTWLVRNAFPGAIDVRPGLLIYTVPGVIFEPSRVSWLFPPAAPLLEAATTSAHQGYR
jgi:hypothetical protein